MLDCLAPLAMTISILTMFLLAAGVGALAWRSLPWGLAAALGLLPLYLWRASLPAPGFALPTTALELVVLAVVAVWLWKRGRQREAWEPVAAWFGPVAFLLLATLVATLVAPDLRAALGLLRAYFLEPLLLFAVMLDTWRTERDARPALAALAVTVIVIGAVAVYQKITGYGIPNPSWQAAETRRITAFYGFPNAVGLFVAPLVVLLFGQAWHSVRRRLYRAAFLPALAAALGVLAAVFAVSQGAMLGMGVGLFLLGVTDRRLRLPALVVAALGLVAVLALTPLRHEAAELMTLADDSGSVRRIVWDDTVRMLADRPVFGNGLSGYQATVAPYHEAPGIEIFMYPHSLLLNFWTELGLLGAAAFLWIVARFGRRAVRAWREHGLWPTGAATCAMAALLVHGLVDVPYFKNDLAILFWLVVALGTIGWRRQAATE